MYIIIFLINRFIILSIECQQIAMQMQIQVHMAQYFVLSDHQSKTKDFQFNIIEDEIIFTFDQLKPQNVHHFTFKNYLKRVVNSELQ